MSALHVAHVVCSDGFAGVERYVLQSAISLTGAGCAVTVVGGADDTMGGPLRSRGIAWRPATTMRQAVAALRRLDGIDVIVSHMTQADLAAVVAGTLRRVPVVSARHFAARRGTGPAHRALAALVATRIRAQIAISGFVADHVEGRCTVVHTGVPDVADVDEALRTPTVLSVQRLEPEKTTDVSIRAWAESGRAGAWRLVVAGDGSQRAELEELARSLGVADSVDFVGFATDVGALLSTASVVIAPTPREGLGLSVIEAMAYGVPVVAAAGGGHLESVGAVEGAALFPPGDATAAGRLLAELIDDPDRRRRYGLALRAEQRAGFGIDSQTSATLEVLRAAVRRRSA